MTTWLSIRPFDVLYLRGNSSFGGPGEHAEALMPPWPSVLSGALRSALLARAGVDLGRFTDEKAEHAHPEYAQVLGTPTDPGSFRLAAVTLARRQNGALQLLLPLPADVVVASHREDDEEKQQSPPCPRKTHDVAESVQRLTVSPDEDRRSPLVHSGVLPALPVLAQGEQGKPSTGWWLTQEGWEDYRAGGTPKPEHLVDSKKLWDTDFRLGIARSRATFTAAEGKIYTTQAVAMRAEVGFAVGVDGCPAELLRGIDLLRLGGDGRGAQVELLQGGLAEATAAANQPFLVYCLTPGLFPCGWLPPGVTREGGECRLKCDGLQARLACAVVPKPFVVSGWDLAAHRPKPAQRAVPAGAVYYFDTVKGDPNRYPQMLWELIEDQLVQAGGPATWDTVWKQRQAEGFNSLLVASWHTKEGGGNV